MLVIFVHGTKRCNTGCRHCLCDSVPTGEDLSLESINDLRKSIKEYTDQKKQQRKVEIVFTGGGEPLQWQQLPEAIAILRDIPEVIFSLVTSGCLDKKDSRFVVLKKAMKEASGKINVNHSFNPFSSTFPKRLEFTLPFILSECTYRDIPIKMVCGLSSKGFYLDEVRRLFEKTLEKAIGRYAKLIHFSSEDNCYLPEMLTPILTEEIKGKGEVFEQWLETKIFKTQTEYFPYALNFAGKKIFTSGSFVGAYGRGKNLSPSTAKNAFYNFSPGYGFSCEARGPALELLTDGQFHFCPFKEFPPIILGTAGDSLGEICSIKEKVARDLNFFDQLLMEPGFNLCEICIRKAWDFVHENMKAA